MDGCRGGWVVAISDGWPPSSLLTVEVCGTFLEVLDVTADCEAVAIDIPIGLPAAKLGPDWTKGRSSNEADPECHFAQRFGKSSYQPVNGFYREGPCASEVSIPSGAGFPKVTAYQRVPASDLSPCPPASWPRVCDVMARELLGGKGKSRLFLAPPRETLSAGDPVTFQALHLKAAGVKASLPVWGILPRIREVDASMTPSLQDRVFEYYPELVWMDLALSTALQRPGSVTGAPPFLAKEPLLSKHTREGIEARLRILEKAGLLMDVHWLTTWEKRLTEELKGTYTHVKLDDLLDALGGLKAAVDFLGRRLTLDFRVTPLKTTLEGGICNELITFFSTPKLVGKGGAPLAFPCSSRIQRLPPTEPSLDSKGLRMEIWY